MEKLYYHRGRRLPNDTKELSLSNRTSNISRFRRAPSAEEKYVRGQQKTTAKTHTALLCPCNNLMVQSLHTHTICSFFDRRLSFLDEMTEGSCCVQDLEKALRELAKVVQFSS